MTQNTSYSFLTPGGDQSNNRTNWIEIVHCFENCHANVGYYTIGFCMGNLLIMLASYIVFAQTVAILVWHLDRKGANELATYRSAATWLLFCLILFEFMVAMRYTFNLLPVLGFVEGVLVVE